MNRNIFIMALLALLSGLCTAAVVNDFESYANTTELCADWTNTSNLQISLNTDLAYVHGGSNSMKYDYNNGASPYYSKSEYRLPGVVWNVSGVDWNAYDYLSLWYKVTVPKEKLKVIIVDCWGSNMYAHDAGVLPACDWTELQIDLKANLTETQLQNVGRVDLVMSAVNYGAGTLYFDDITLIPEPMTLVLFGLGGVMLRRRK